MDEAKPWMCPSKRHVLGLVVRNGSGVRQLLLYREAMKIASPEIAPPEIAPQSRNDMGEVDVMAVVEGYVADVRCSICGRVRTWVPGQEAIERLLATVRAMNDGRNQV